MVAATPGNNAAADFPGEGNSLGIVVRAAAPKDKPLCTGNSSYVCKSAVKAKLVFADVGGACTLRTAFPVAK
jgi:hypothetical protein